MEVLVKHTLRVSLLLTLLGGCDLALFGGSSRNAKGLEGADGGTMAADARCVDCVPPGDCGCPGTWDPICGEDGVTYANACEAECAAAVSACAGECPCGAVCGDGLCQDSSAVESCETCPSDCGPCSGCGDGICDTGEDCVSCAEDCGPCGSCGDGTCGVGAGEDCSNCAQDCGPCPICGDGACNAAAGETCASCAADCGPCPTCGDGSCNAGAGESCASCPADCGACPTCGDGTCDPGTGEDCVTCPADCGACSACGDGFCSSAAAEDCQTCPADCGACGCGASFEMPDGLSFLPGDGAIASAIKEQTTVFLAPGGSNVLAVWSDNRANSTGGYEGETSRDIYGMMLDAQGNPLDTVPFWVAALPASQEIPKAAYNGTNWLVVYESYDENGTGYYQKSLQAVRVAPDTCVLDEEPIKIWSASPISGTWSVASDGSNWVIAVQDDGGVTKAMRIAADGTLLDVNAPIVVPGTYYLRGPYRLAYAGGVFLLAYEESMTGHDPTSYVRFDADLNLLDVAPAPLLVSPVQGLASNGSGFYAAWTEQLPDYTMAVMGTRISPDGQKLDGSGVNLSGPNAPDGYEHALTSVVWDGSNWKAIWSSGQTMRVARINTGGTVLDPGGVAVPGPLADAVASAGNGSLQVAWGPFSTSNNDYDVITAHISAGNTAGPNRTIAIGAPAQMSPDVAAGTGGFMATYLSTTSASSRALAQPLDATGQPLTAEPLELAAADAASGVGTPAVAWNGSLYLVAWGTSSGIVARRLQPDGTPVDASPIAVLDGSFAAVDVEAMGDDFLVAGLLSQSLGGCGYSCWVVTPRAMRVRGTDGALLDAAPIEINGAYGRNVRVAVLGGRWLVVWLENVSYDSSAAYTKGVFIDGSGVKGTEFQIQAFSTGGGNGIFGVGLASSGDVALVVQPRELTSGVENDLLGQLIDPDGTVHPYFNLTPWEGNQYRPGVAWDGAEFVLVYQDQRMRVVQSGIENLDARSDLFGMRITPDGVVLDPQGFLVSNRATGEAYPTVASGGGATLIAGSIMRNVSPFANYRIGYRMLGAGVNAWPVAIASANPASGEVPVSVTFSSAGSQDPDGSVAAYAWSFGDGATSTAPNPGHLYTVGGPYVATLTVTDDQGATSQQELLVNVTEPNFSPVAVISSNVVTGPLPLDVTFYTAGSYDADGFMGNMHWDMGDGGESWGETAYYTFYNAGTWLVTLTIYDGRGGTGTDTILIDVGPPLPPVAPSDLLAIPFTSDWINMTWTDNSNNEDGFKVERCPGDEAYCAANPSAFVEVFETGPNIDYYGDTGLPSLTTYTYRVRAFNVSGISAYSSTSTATTL